MVRNIMQILFLISMGLMVLIIPCIALLINIQIMDRG